MRGTVGPLSPEGNGLSRGATAQGPGGIAQSLEGIAQSAGSNAQSPGEDVQGPASAQSRESRARASTDVLVDQVRRHFLCRSSPGRNLYLCPCLYEGATPLQVSPHFL